MYTIESLKKVVRLMNETRDRYDAVETKDIKLCISTGNKKIGRVMNVSLAPLVTCGNCDKCKWFCYDIKACLQYPNTVIDARMRNTIIFQRDIDEYFRRIDAACSRRRSNKYFRWHVSGEITSKQYLANMVQIAKKHSDFRFWTYTIMYSLVNEYVAENGASKDAAVPENLVIMFSEWDGTPLENPYGFPVFSVKMKDGNKNHKPEYFDNLYKCPGNCDVCKASGRGCIYGENVYAEEH